MYSARLFVACSLCWGPRVVFTLARATADVRSGPELRGVRSRVVRTGNVKYVCVQDKGTCTVVEISFTYRWPLALHIITIKIVIHVIDNVKETVISHSNV